MCGMTYGDNFMNFTDDKYQTTTSFGNPYEDKRKVITREFKDENKEPNVDYEPIQMPRFTKYQPKNSKEIHIIDNMRLSKQLRLHEYPEEAIIFIASTSSEWVNHEIIDEVLRLINTNKEYVREA